MKGRGRRRPPSTYRVELLEPRLLLSADLTGGLAPTWSPQFDDPADRDAPLSLELLAALDLPDRSADTEGSPDALDLDAMASLQPERVELVVIDAAVENHEQLLDALRADRDPDVRFEVHVLDAGTDGVQALSDILDGYRDVDAVHIVSHGSGGSVQLGDARLDAASLDSHAEAIRGWSDALANDADLLFYGCDVASTSDGLELLDALGALTGADIAASTDPTGQAQLGGDWELEHHAGSIDTAVAFAGSVTEAWAGVLATTFTVDTFTDTVDVNPGDGVAEDAFGNTSLRAAVMEANALAGADTIVLSAGTYTLTLAGLNEDNSATGDLDLKSDITLIGAGAAATTIDAAKLDRALDLRAAGPNSIAVSGLTITGGDTKGALQSSGGGVRIANIVTATFTDVVLLTNLAEDSGGAIHNAGTLTLQDVVVSSNDAGFDGGGIFNAGSLTADGLLVAGNTANDFGGGIYTTVSASLTVLTNATVSGNSADTGGGLYDENGATLTNVTIADNLANIIGGGIYADGVPTLTNTLVANNTSPLGADISGTIASTGDNLVRDTTGASGLQPGDITGTDPFLGVLQDNGGTSMTHALLAGSPAISAADAGAAPAGDQRGYVRDGAADIGAFEFAAGPGLDTDGDGLWDTEEDSNADADNNPSTGPGPDTDGDGTPNYLDPDDDGDGTPSSAENADPNADGDPRDAADADRDGQADYLDRPTVAADGTVASEQKLSDTEGSLGTPIGPDDNLGRSVAAIGDLDGDGIVDIAIGVDGSDDGGNDRGAVQIVFLNADGTAKSERIIDSDSGGLGPVLDDGDSFGRSVAGLGDIDGDGINDIAVGAHKDDDGSGNAGAIYILFLNDDGSVKAQQKISATTGGLTTAIDGGDFFGVSVANAGDIDGDGINDLVVGAPRDDDGGSDSGAVRILFLNPDGTVRAEQKISSTTGGFAGGLDADDRFGVSVAGIGDLDGDGTGDIVVGAQRDDDGATDSGAVYVLFLNPDGTVKAQQKISSASGGFTLTLDEDDRFGFSVAGVGDVNADGNNDIVVGAHFDDDGGPQRGAVHVLFLDADGTVVAEQKLSATSGGLTASLDDDDRFGAAVAGIGDLDGDGSIDLVVGAPNDDDGGNNNGAVHVLKLALGSPTPNIAPTGTDNVVSTFTDTAYTFSVVDFGYSDVADGHNLEDVVISSLPAQGTLVNNGVAVSAGEAVPIADILAGNLVFTPDTGDVGTGYATIGFQVRDDGGTAGGGANTDPVAKTLTVNVRPAELWLSSKGDSSPSDTNLASWNRGDVVAFGDSATFGEGSTSGDFEFQFKFTMNDDGDLGDADLRALHHVTRTVTVGEGASSFTLQPGDLLGALKLADDGAVTLISSNTLDVTRKDIFVFRPDTAGDYSSGTFTMLLDNPVGSNIHAVTLVEVATELGTSGTSLDAGSLLIAHSGGAVHNEVYLFEPTATGAATAGVKTLLLDGTALGFVDQIQGLELLEEKTTIGDTSVGAGGLLISLNVNNSVAGVPVTAQDIVELRVSDTELGGGTAAAASILFDGSNVGLDDNAEIFDGLTFAPASTPANNAPSGTDDAVAIAEDAVHVFATDDFGFLDPGDNDSLKGVKIVSLPGAGVLTNDGVSVNAGDTVSALDISNGKLRFTPTADANGTPYASFTFQVQDDGGTADGGSDLDPTPNTLTINVTPVNDAPSLTIGGDQDVDEDAGPVTVVGFASATSGGGADESSQTFTYTVTNDNAALFAQGPAIDANGDLTYRLKANVVGTATVTVSVTDNGGTGSGGDNTSPDQTFDITIAPINDEPSFTIAGDQNVDEDAGAVTVAGFASAEVGGGPAEFGQSVTYTVSNDNAALFAIGPAIDANGDLTYTLADDAVGTATVTVSVSDDGGTDNGGDDTSPNQTFDIIVAPVNDAPSFTIAGDQDVDEDAGAVTVSGFASATPGGGNDESTQTFSYTVTNDNATLFAVGPAIDANGNLTYTLADDAAGSATVTVALIDSGGTANGGDNSAPDQTFDITVAPVNDAPILTIGSDQNVDEDAGAVTVVGFASATAGGGADESSQAFSYNVTNDNAALFAVGPAIDANGDLTYTLADDAVGSATVTVSVSDNGGTANGGDDTSADQTFDISVAAVNDAPSFSIDGDQDVDEDAGAATVVGFASATPGGGTDESSQTFTYTVTNDNAALFAVGPAIDANGDLTYTLADDAVGSATVTVSMIDSGGTTNGGDNSAPGQTFDITVAPVNDAPTLTIGGDQNVDEDAGAVTVVGFASATPGGGTDESSQAFTYTVTNDNAALFAVGPAIDANGDLTYTLADDAVGAATVTVAVSDNGGTANGGDNTSPDQTFDIAVAAVNDAPTLTIGGDQDVDEDAGAVTVVGFASATPGGGTDEASQAFTYTVTSDNAALFAIGPAIDANGDLTYTLADDAVGSATVTVSLSDNGGTANGGDNSAPDKTFEITVAPVNDAPSLTIAGDQDVDEDAGAVTVVGFASATPGGGADEASQAFSYTVTIDNAALFAVGPAIDANGDLTYTLADDAVGSATVTVAVSDNGGTANGGDNTSADQTFDITAAPVNDAPSFSIAGDQNVDEDTGAVTVVGFASAAAGGGADEASQAFTYTVTNDNAALFAVGPTIDANGDLTYTLADDAVGSATVTVSMTDSGGTTNGGDNSAPDQTFDINTAAVNDAPSLTIGGDQDVDEDDGAVTVVGFASATAGGGADEASQAFTYTVTNDNAALFAVGPAIDANGALTYTLADDAVGSATVTVSVSDDGGTGNGGDNTSADQTFDITVAPINDAPSFTISGDQDVDEDAGAVTVVGFASATPGGGTDESSQVFSYTVTSDNAALFAVGPAIDANGDLTYTLADDAVGSATVTVSMTDSGGTTNGGDNSAPDQTFDITVAPVNDAPTLTIAGDQDVDEDAGAVTVVGFASATPGGGTDEASQAFTYTVTNDNAALFAVGPAIDANGDLTYTLKDDAVGSATVTVAVSDNGGTANGGDNTSPDKTFDINVAPVNDAPSFTIAGDQDVDEDAGAVTVAGFASATAGGGADESTQAFSYTVTSDNAALFAVGPTIDANGDLTYTLADDAVGSATVTVSMTDSGGTTNGGDNSTPDQTFDINVAAVNDAPSLTIGGDQDVDEDAGAVTVVGFASATAGGGDDESSQAFTYTVTNDNAALFAVGPAIDANGDLTYRLKDNVVGSATVTVSVSDNGGTANGGDNTSADQSFDITVAPVNDAPSFSIDGDQNVDEDADAVTVVGFASATPGGGADETGQAFNYTVTSDNAALFAVGPAIDANGDLTYTLADDAVGSATITVSMTDSGGTTNGGDNSAPAQTFDITVAPVNDAPTFSLAGDQDVAQNSGAHTVPGFATAQPGGGVDEAAQTFTYAVTNDNAAMFAVAPSIDSSGQLTYTLNPGASGTALVAVTVTDSGGTSNGGNDTSSTRTFQILVDALNLAPAGADGSITAVEDTARTLGLDDFGFIDADGDRIAAVHIDAVPATGVLALNGTPVSVGQVITAEDIANGAMVFTPEPGANGSAIATLSFRVQDDGGTRGGGANLDPVSRTLVVDVTPVNDAPSGADASVLVSGGAPYVFSTSLFGFADPEDGDSLLAIQIVSLPTVGVLTLNGDPVAAGDTVSADDIAAGRLVFSPGSGTGPAPTTGFSFRVQDSGGTTNGGEDIDPVANRVTLEIASTQSTEVVSLVTPSDPPDEDKDQESSAADQGNEDDAGSGTGDNTGGDRSLADEQIPESETLSGTTGEGDDDILLDLALDGVSTDPTDTFEFRMGLQDDDDPDLEATTESIRQVIPQALLPFVVDVDQAANFLQIDTGDDDRPDLVVTEVGIALGVDQMRESMDDDISIRQFEFGQTTTAAVGLSVGYVSWLLRGGVLLSTVLSSMPAWRFIDPLPVFSGMGGRPGEEDDESLAGIVQGGSDTQGPADADAAPPVPDASAPESSSRGSMT